MQAKFRCVSALLDKKVRLYGELPMTANQLTTRDQPSGLARSTPYLEALRTFIANQRTTVPSVMDMPNLGIFTGMGMDNSLSFEVGYYHLLVEKLLMIVSWTVQTTFCPGRK